MNNIKFIALLLLTTFLMGSSFAIVKLGLPYSSPLLLAALRFIVAGVLMAVIVLLLKKTSPNDKSQLVENSFDWYVSNCWRDGVYIFKLANDYS